MLAAALNHGRVPETVFFDPEFADALPAAARARWSRSRSTSDALASAGQPRQRVAGDRRLAEQRSGSDARHARALYLHDVADPGNVGTILRAAQAFGAGPVVLSPRTADPFGPKAVRASMGAIFGQPVARATWDEARGASDHAGGARARRRARRCGS